METTIVYWGYIGIMETKMETTIVHSAFLGKIFAVRLCLRRFPDEGGCVGL